MSFQLAKHCNMSTCRVVPYLVTISHVHCIGNIATLKKKTVVCTAHQNARTPMVCNHTTRTVVCTSHFCMKVVYAAHYLTAFHHNRACAY